MLNFLLGFFVFYNDNTYSNINEFAIQFVPRLTLVILIQTFAYFFLKLYKSGLDEIKFFQNELTDVQQRQIALLSAKQLADKDTLKEVIRVIVSSDRNRAGLSSRPEAGLESERLFDLAKQALSSITTKSAEAPR